MNSYPFVVRGKNLSFATKIKAINYRMALNKILELYPGKHILIKYSNMDLISAKVEAAKLSKQQGKTIFINVDKEGECEVSENKNNTTYACYKNGNEVKVEEELPSEESKTKKEKAMKKTKEQPVKKAQAKKTAAKKVVEQAKKSPSSSIKGAKKEMSVKAAKELVKKGQKLYNEAGKPLPFGYLNKMADQNRVIKVTIAG